MPIPRFYVKKWVQAAVLALVFLSLLFGLGLFYRVPVPRFLSGLPSPQTPATSSEPNATLLELAHTYIHSILNPSDATLPRLECRQVNSIRYGYLRAADASAPSQSPSKYFFALDIRQKVELLPRLIGSIVEVIRYLGPERCSISIIEGHSTDGTSEILSLLKTDIEKLGAKYSFASSDLDPAAGERIEKLAQLRNLALAPLERKELSDTTIIFLNDVAICEEDILELVHQRLAQKAEMTCGMDWTYVGNDPTFYDVWIARGMNGDSFFEIPPDGNWNSAWNLFWNNPQARSGLNNHRPFQVFSCWNGAVVFTAKVLERIKFRSPNRNECHQGEPSLFCKDMWLQGFDKIAVVPTVNLEYSDEDGKRIKDLKGYVSDWVDKEDPNVHIEWEAKPPEKVKCMKNYAEQVWLPWDEGL